MKPFIYKWTELSTGKWYIGSRTAKGCHPDDGYVCSSKVVRPLIDANPSDWRREILFLGGENDGRLVTEKEAELLQQLDAKNDPMSYNQHNGDGKFSTAGGKHSEESKAKISAAKKGKTRGPMSEEQKAKMSAAQKGKKMSEESKAKLSASRKGKTQGPMSEEQKAKMSAAQKGKRHSEESKAKMSTAERQMREETKAKISGAKKE